ncbi:MAG: GNAT family N-acetyltransferase [Nanoarchaeota archaeon]
MNIRKATLKDCPALEQINVLAQKETGWWIPQNAQFYKKFLKKNNNDLLVAYKANNLIGFLSLEYNKEQKSTWINDVFVIPSSRKKGIAKQLVKMAINRWKNKSSSIVLLTSDNNMPVFERMGFKKKLNFMRLSRSED